MLIDTHCHLDYLVKEGDLGGFVDSAASVGVRKIITISTLTSRFQKEILPISLFKDGIFCTIGTHPDNVLDDIFDPDYALEVCNLYKHKVVGIGETGIDLYDKNNPALSLQVESLEKHAYVAKKTGLPLIFHSRSAENETIRELSRLQDGSLGCIMHCFTGSWDLAKFCLDLGCYISVSGIVTFKNADSLREVVKKIPTNRIIIETDAPFLAPTPMRGKKNEPSFLVYTANFLSDFLDIKIDKFCEILWENSHSAFRVL